MIIIREIIMNKKYFQKLKKLEENQKSMLESQ